MSSGVSLPSATVRALLLLRPHNVPSNIEQALLDTVYRQSTRIPIPVTIVAAVVGGMGAGLVSGELLVGWIAMVALMQFVRFFTIRSLVRERSGTPGSRLNRATALSAVNGVVIASSAAFFPALDEVSRAIYSMTMIGLTAGSVAISHGYRPMFMALAAPVLLSLAVAWAVVPAESIPAWMRYSIVTLILLLGFVLYGLGKDAFAAFSENYRINAELERALRAEQSANNAKTRFLAAASHDLRQPLHTLSLLSAALAVRPLDSKSASIARSMNEAMSDLASELDSLLDISKLDAGVVRVEYEPVDVGVMVVRIKSGFAEQAARRGLSLEVDLQSAPVVHTDRVLLERLLRNLVDNAIKYTDRGRILIVVQERLSRCEILVVDSGSGIPEGEQERVFEEFYQIGNVERDRKKGLGLGLSIVKRLAGLLQCELELQSMVGRGTTFRIAFPASTETRGRPEAPPLEQCSDLSGLHFLLIEDDIGVRAATRILLEELGGQVSEATNAAEALAVMDDSTPDVVLADIRLPDGESGFDAVARLRLRDPALRVLLISGETSPDRLRDADRLGAPLLVKPVDQATLLRAIGRILQRTPHQ